MGDAVSCVAMPKQILRAQEAIFQSSLKTIGRLLTVKKQVAHELQQLVHCKTCSWLAQSEALGKLAAQHSSLAEPIAVAAIACERASRTLHI